LGYGHIYPISNSASIAAAFESLLGLLSFAIATGILFGRFSRPKADLLYSKNILILLLGLLINFFPFMPTGGFFNSWLTTICLLPVAFLFYLKNNNINK
jgi:hypothetical protein